jgi:hypothetical protein
MLLRYTIDFYIESIDCGNLNNTKQFFTVVDVTYVCNLLDTNRLEIRSV